MPSKTQLNNGIVEKDIRMKSMVQHKAPLWINTFVTDSINENWEYPNAEALKQQILNNQAIVEALQKDLKETEESFLETKDDVNRRILDYHSVMVKAVLRETYHSKSFGGTK